MDYEVMYQQIQLFEKDLKDKSAAIQKCLKSIQKNTEKGDLKNCSKDLNQMQTLAAEQETKLAEFNALITEFDAKEYFESGAFAEQMLTQCQEQDVDVNGQFPVYEMFPYKVKIDCDNLDLYVDRKKYQCMRPFAFVKTIKTGREKLLKANFNPNAFVNELAECYDLALIKKNKETKSNTRDSDLFLKDLYTYLVPMQRFRRDYDLQSYAFDLARLYQSDVETTKDGRSFQFGPSRKSNKLIRILDNDGCEQFLATIRFY